MGPSVQGGCYRETPRRPRRRRSPPSTPQTHPRRPPFPQVLWNFTLPYVSELQEGGLVYQYEAYQDYGAALQKVIRDGVETVIIRVDDDVMYEIFPAMDSLLCWKGGVHGGTGPTKRRRKLSMAAAQRSGGGGDAALSAPSNGDDPPQSYLGFVLPNLSEKRWRYKGTEEYERTGADAHVWEWDLTGVCKAKQSSKYINRRILL